MSNYTGLGSIVAAMLPVIMKYTGENYDKYPALYKEVCTMKKTDRLYEQLVAIMGLGLHGEQEEGELPQSQSVRQAHMTTIRQKSYGLVHQVTADMIAFNQAPELALTAAKRLVDSEIRTKESLFAQMLDRSRNSSYTGGDGKELVATDHNLGTGSTGTNELSTPITFSQAGIMELVYLIENMVDEAGYPIMMESDLLIIPKQLVNKARVIMGTEYEVGSSNNDANPVVKNKLIRDHKCGRFLTDSTAYYVTAKASAVGDVGLLNLSMNKAEINTEVDNIKRIIQIASHFKTVFAWHDWRQIAGTAGV